MDRQARRRLAIQVALATLVIFSTACRNGESGVVDRSSRHKIPRVTPVPVRGSSGQSRHAVRLTPTSVGAPPVSTPTTQPRPEYYGPNAVGSTSDTVVDDERHRRIEFTIRYPATGASTDPVRWEAAPLRSSGPFPVFVWSPGLDATPTYYETYLDTWARAGYVVVAPTFPETSTGTGQRVFDDYVNQPRDVTLVLDRLLSRDGHARQVLGDLMDPSRIAAGGHSLGAITTEGLTDESCCLDTRVNAAIRIDYGDRPFPDSRPVSRSLPQLFVHGTADTTFPISDSRQAFMDAKGRRFFVELRGIGHTPFYTSAEPLILQVTTDFLDYALKGRASSLAWLSANAVTLDG
jgi:hypothetical protein